MPKMVGLGRRRLVATLTLALIATATSVFVQTTRASAVDACQNGAYIVFLRGSGTALDGSEKKAFFGGVQSKLDSAGISSTSFEIDYPATGFTGWLPTAPKGTLPEDGDLIGYATSRAQGSANLANFLGARYQNGKCPNETLVLGGYSQGAHAISYLLSLMPEYILHHIGFVGLYGDPRFYMGDYAACVAGQPRPFWYRGNSFCNTIVLGVSVATGGSLKPRNPYVPSVLQGRVGSWCDAADFICTSNTGFTLNLLNGTSAHYRYDDDGGWMQQSASEIANAARSKVAELNPPPAPVGATLAVGSYVNGQQYVFWKGGDGLLWEAWYANNVWNGPKVFPQFGVLGSAPTVAVNPLNGHQHVFWKSGGGSLMQAWWDGSWHGPQDLGAGPLGSAPAATAFGNEVDVFWKGADGNLWEKWWNGSIWQCPFTGGADQ